MKNSLSLDIFSKLNESDKSEDFRTLLSDIQNCAEMYDESQDSEDVFAGTEDSYAFEVMEQNLSDAILYNGLFKGEVNNYDLLTNFINEVIDYITDNNAITEEWLRNLLSKYSINI